LRNGHKLDQVWINPKYDVASGFIVGKVETTVEGPFINTIDYFPGALQRLQIPGSTNVLNVTVTYLATREASLYGVYGATMGVEGSVVDRDGQVMFAFITREDSNNRESVPKNCVAVMDRVAWGIFKELGKPFQEAHERLEKAAFGNPSGLVPPRPTQTQTLTVGERLIQLDNLRKSGLITDEDYNKHKEEILKGM
jgi:hypothetical protein